MTANKQTVAAYMAAFKENDHDRILACLTEDVIWEMPGRYHHVGKAAFDKEIENDAFEGKPDIATTLMVEENNIVVAEGTVQTRLKGGQPLSLVFCDVFYLENHLIKRLVSYVMPLPAANS